MNIEIKPELEKIVREEIQSGHFNTVDELLTEALYALRDRQSTGTVVSTQAEAIKRAKDLTPLSGKAIESVKEGSTVNDEKQVFVERRPQGDYAVRKPTGRKSLAQLFAESPFKGLDLQFERDPDTGRPVTLLTASCWTRIFLPN